jgi:hypothetical protein
MHYLFKLEAERRYLIETHGLVRSSAAVLTTAE